MTSCITYSDAELVNECFETPVIPNYWGNNNHQGPNYGDQCMDIPEETTAPNEQSFEHGSSANAQSNEHRNLGQIDNNNVDYSHDQEFARPKQDEEFKDINPMKDDREFTYEDCDDRIKKIIYREMFSNNGQLTSSLPCHETIAVFESHIKFWREANRLRFVRMSSKELEQQISEKIELTNSINIRANELDPEGSKKIRDGCNQSIRSWKQFLELFIQPQQNNHVEDMNTIINTFRSVYFCPIGEIKKTLDDNYQLLQQNLNYFCKLYPTEDHLLSDFGKLNTNGLLPIAFQQYSNVDYHPNYEKCAIEPFNVQFPYRNLISNNYIPSDKSDFSKPTLPNNCAVSVVQDNQQYKQYEAPQPSNVSRPSVIRSEPRVIMEEALPVIVDDPTVDVQNTVALHEMNPQRTQKACEELIVKCRPKHTREKRSVQRYGDEERNEKVREGNKKSYHLKMNRDRLERTQLKNNIEDCNETNESWNKTFTEKVVEMLKNWNNQLSNSCAVDTEKNKAIQEARKIEKYVLSPLNCIICKCKPEIVPLVQLPTTNLADEELKKKNISNASRRTRHKQKQETEDLKAKLKEVHCVVQIKYDKTIALITNLNEQLTRANLPVLR